MYKESVKLMQNVLHTKKNYVTFMKTKLITVFKSTGLVLLAFTFCKHLFVNGDKCFNIIHVVDFFLQKILITIKSCQKQSTVH